MSLRSPDFTRITHCIRVIAAVLNNLSWPNKNRLGICLCFDLHQDKSAVLPQWSAVYRQRKSEIRSAQTFGVSAGEI